MFNLALSIPFTDCRAEARPLQIHRMAIGLFPILAAIQRRHSLDSEIAPRRGAAVLRSYKLGQCSLARASPSGLKINKMLALQSLRFQATVTSGLK
jgi:hypothetical protein